MVRGKKQAVSSKPQTTKKGQSRGNAHASPALPTGGPPDKSVTLVSIASCSACGKVVGDDTQALQCDRCLSADSWKCAECLDLSGDMYERLMSSDLVSIRWFCDGCDKLV